MAHCRQSRLVTPPPRIHSTLNTLTDASIYTWPGNDAADIYDAIAVLATSVLIQYEERYT